MTESSSLAERAIRANLAAYDGAGAAGYADSAPHLRHRHLRRLYASLLVEVFEKARQHAPIPRVLDLGAGEGTVTLPMLELGASVVAVDISPDQLATLRRKCAVHEGRLCVRCEDIYDTLRQRDDRYDVIVANSFLHHIPDYLAMIREAIPRLSPHGQFFSFQDPLWYPSQNRIVRFFERSGYAFWRLRQGDVLRGAQRYWRRSRGVFLADSPHDNAEFHVVRSGVNQEEIRQVFGASGFDCRIVSYFSTQSRLFQLAGTALGFRNTFACIANRSVSRPEMMRRD